ncbi:MAG: HipA family kinase [Anaerolineales bacterium]
MSIDNDIIAQKLAEAANHRPQPLIGETFLRRVESFSRPIWLECNDNNVYVVKGQHAGRAIFNDQIIARLGYAIGAPVGTPALIIIPHELQQAEPKLQDIMPGVAHGTLWIKDTTDRQWITYSDKGYNRSRFALLSILYGWLCASDQQLIYSNQEPYLVYSVDHGHFFPQGPNWTIGSLATVTGVELHSELYNSCGLSDLDIRNNLDGLTRLTDAAVLEIVALPPDEWGVSMEERIEMSKFIMTRRDEMLAKFVS